MAAGNLRYVIYDNQDENFVYIEYWIDDDFGLTLSSIEPIPRDAYKAFQDGGGVSVQHRRTDEYLIYQRPAAQFYRFSSNYDPYDDGWTAYAPIPFIAVQEINWVLQSLSAGMLPGPSSSDDLTQGVTNLYMTVSERSKLSGIAAGAEVNVNANWAAIFGDAQILNKPDIFLNRYDSDAETAREAADATLTIERYVTVQADGHGEKTAAQSSTPTEGNKLVRKIWHKATAFEDSDVTTWTLAHTFADNTAYIDTIDTFQELLAAATYGSIPLTLAQTWESVPEAETLLDLFPGAALALSAARLVGNSSTYTGPLIRVRRASDSAEQDIGFDGDGLLDESALATFCAGTDGFVRTFYDQSGNGNDATQTNTASQPKVYDSVTGVELENAKAALKFLSNYLTLPSAVWDKGDISVFTVCQASNTEAIAVHLSPDSAADWAVLSIGSSITSGNFGSILYTNATKRDEDTGAYTLGTQILSSTISDVSTQILEQYLDSAAVSGNESITAAVGSMALGSRRDYVAEKALSGTIQEVIVYPSDQSANRAAIETNINDFYSIY